MGFKDKILDPQTTTSTEFAGDTLNDIADYFSAVDMTQGGAQPSKNVDINTETLFSTGSLKLWDSNKSHKISITTPDYTETKTLSLPSEASLGASDEFLFKDSVATVTGKSMDFTTDNTATNIPTSALPSSIFYDTQDNDAGQHYMDFTQLAGTPSNPPSTVRRLFVDTTGKLSVRTSGGSTIDLEAAAIGDSGGISAGGTATFSGSTSNTTFNIAHGLSPTPDFADVSPMHEDAMGPFYFTIDSTNIVVEYPSGTPTGTNNIILLWAAGYNTQAEPGFTPSSVTTMTNKTFADILNVNKTAESGAETLAELKVSDSSSYIRFLNDSTTNGVFEPRLDTRIQSGQSGRNAFQMNIEIDPADDTGTQEVFKINMRRSDYTEITTRNLLTIEDDSVPQLTMGPGGHINFHDHYTEFGDITDPANPASGTVRLFNSSSTGLLSVRKSGGITVPIEPIGSSKFRYTIYIDPADGHTKLLDNNDGTIAATSSGSTVEAVFNTALSAGSSARSIEVRDGTYDVSGSFTGFDTLRAYQHIVFAKQALVRVPSGYTGRMWLIDQDPAANKHGVLFEGGRFEENGFAANWTCFLIDAADNPTQTGAGIGDCTIRDVHIDNAGIAFELKTDDEGWINGCLFDNIRIHRPRTGVKFTDVGNSTEFCNRNIFSNIIIQATGIHEYGFRDINGKDNMFLHCKAWDFVTVPTSQTATISSNASYTKIFGGIMRFQNYVDNGTNTFALDEFNDEETGSRYPAGYLEVGGGLAVNDITTIGNNDLDFKANSSDTSFNTSFVPNSNSDDVSVSMYNTSKNERLFFQKQGTTAYNLDMYAHTSSGGGSLRPFRLRTIDQNVSETREYMIITPSNKSLELASDTDLKLGFFNVTPAVQQTGAAQTAGGSYGSTEQDMLQKAYDALRTFGFLA